MRKLSLAKIDFSQGTGHNTYHQVVQHLSVLKELDFLDLSYTGLNSMCLVVLAQLPALSDLIISGNQQAGYDALKQLAKLTELTRLLCDGTSIQPNQREAFERLICRQLLY
jgi:hypothetical protein